MKPHFSEFAQKDIRNIADYTYENWGEEQEVEYLRSIDTRVQEIAGSPERFRPRNDLFRGCQVAPVGQHLIVFLVEGDAIIISRVLHQSMDFPRHIFPLR